METEVEVKLLLLPNVLAEIIKGRESLPIVQEGIDLESKTAVESLIASDNLYQDGRAMEQAIGRLLMDTIVPKLGELGYKGDVTLTLVAKRE